MGGTRGGLIKQMKDHKWQGYASREKKAIDLCVLLAFENSIKTLTNERRTWLQDGTEPGMEKGNAKVREKEQKNKLMLKSVYINSSI